MRYEHRYELGENQTKTKQIIFNYRDIEDIDVMDENANYYWHCTYDAFKHGTLLNPEEQEISKHQGVILDKQDSATYRIYGKKPNKLMTPQALLSYHRNQTYRDVMQNLKFFGRCAMIRPCGFGKTMMAYRIFEGFQKCLFIYPSGDPYSMFELMKKVHRNSKHQINVECHNYNWLYRLTDDEIRALDYDFIFFDEMHKLGGEKTSVVAQKIIKAHKGHCCFVGATATPNRMDGRDVLGTLFHNHQPYEYTLENALEDGIIQRPHYFYTAFNIREYVKDIGKEINHGKISEEMVNKIMGHSALRQLELDELPNQIRNIQDSIMLDKKYFKYIVFCDTIKKMNFKNKPLTNASIEELADENIGIGAILKNAYPDYTVNVYKFHSRVDNISEDDMTDADENQLLKDTQAIRDLPTTDKTIDVIVSCDRLCCGYHDENLSGIMMYRTTKSHIKFTQMIGRAFSCIGDNPIIIYDIADNFHIRPEFNFKKTEKVEFDEVHKPLPTWEELVELHNKYYKNKCKVTSKKSKSTKKNNNSYEEAQTRPTNIRKINKDENINDTDFTKKIINDINRAQKLREQYYSTDDKSLDNIKPIKSKTLAQINEWESVSGEINGERTVSIQPKSNNTSPVKFKGLDKIEITQISESILKDKNYIKCNHINHADNMINKSSVITENTELNIKDVITKIIKEPDDRVKEEAYKAYLEVEATEPITTMDDIIGNTEKAEFQAKILSVYAQEYNIPQQMLVKYILENQNKLNVNVK